jgi:hypothetical protein
MQCKEDRPLVLVVDDSEELANELVFVVSMRDRTPATANPPV